MLLETGSNGFQFCSNIKFSNTVKVENGANEWEELANELSRRPAEGITWLLLAADNQMQKKRDKLKEGL